MMVLMRKSSIIDIIDGFSIAMFDHQWVDSTTRNTWNTFRYGCCNPLVGLSSSTSSGIHDMSQSAHLDEINKFEPPASHYHQEEVSQKHVTTRYNKRPLRLSINFQKVVPSLVQTETACTSKPSFTRAAFTLESICSHVGSGLGHGLVLNTELTKFILALWMQD